MLAGIGLAILATGAASAGVFNPETFMLGNGMQVVVIPNHRAPVATQMVWYRVGSADEAPGESGIAHFLEHLMFKGTKKRAPGEFSKIVARNGGRENAFTSFDYTAYHQTFAVDRLETMMEMEADRMTNLTITEKEVEPERQVVLEERRMRTDNNPSSILREQVAAVQYYNYPYRRPIIGWEHEIRALDLDRIRAFYKRWYAPNNAILVVAGDITAAKLKPLAEKYFGAIPAQPPTPRARPEEPPQSTARVVTLKDARVRQPSWSRSFMAPSYSYGDSGHAYALEVLAEILGGGATSRLYSALVVGQGVADSAGSYYDPGNRGPSLFGFYAQPRRGNTVEQIETAVLAEVARLLKDGTTEDEVARAKKRLMAEAVFARDSLTTGARAIGSALAVGRTVEDVESWPDRIGAVTAAQVMAAAKTVLSQRGHVTARLLPADQP